MVLPPFTDEELSGDNPPSDWNDYAELHRLESGKSNIASALESGKVVDEEQPEADDGNEFTIPFMKTAQSMRSSKTK